MLSPAIAGSASPVRLLLGDRNRGPRYFGSSFVSIIDKRLRRLSFDAPSNSDSSESKYSLYLLRSFESSILNTKTCFPELSGEERTKVADNLTYPTGRAKFICTCSPKLEASTPYLTFTGSKMVIASRLRSLTEPKTACSRKS